MTEFTMKHLEKARTGLPKRRILTDNQYLSMIENATHQDCELLAANVADDAQDVKELTDELYSFVLGDNESELAFEIFKDDIDKQGEV